MNPSASPSKLLAVALSEWLLVLPAALLLAAAALRLLQPRQYEPARASAAIFDWASAHISHAGAGLLFIAMPALAVVAGGTALLLLWHHNQTLRQDLTAAVASLRRHFTVAILGTGTLLAAAILAAVLAHLVTD